MKKTLLAITIGLTAITASTAFAACEKNDIGFLNVQSVFSTSALGQAKIKADQEKFQPQAAALEKKVQDLQKKVQQFAAEQKANSATQPTAEATQAQSDLQSAVAEYKALATKAQQQSQDDAQAFQDALSAASTEVATKKGLQAVLPSEISLYSTCDITEEVSAQLAASKA